jgi:hypothetical protein
MTRGGPKRAVETIILTLKWADVEEVCGGAQFFGRRRCRARSVVMGAQTAAIASVSEAIQSGARIASSLRSSQ